MHKVNINYPFIIFLIALILCLQNIWGPSIYILDEAKNATCAREMMESGDHIVPTYNYQLRTDKPPLHYYFMMVGYKVFGVNAFGARFFSAVFGALTVLITFLYTRKLFSKEVALISALALLSSLHFVLQFHLAVPDPYLIFFMTLAGFAFIDGIIKNNRPAFMIAYVAIGFGILAKGPVALLLPALSLAMFMIFTKRFNLSGIFSMKPFLGLLIILAIALPWYVAVGIMTEGEWLRGFFIEHNMDRFSDPKEGHGGLFIKTWIFVIGGMLPMSAFIIQSFRNWWQERENEFLFYCGIVAIVIILFFTIADTRLPNYTVPAYPFLAVLFAAYLWKVIEKINSFRWFSMSSSILFLLYIIIPLGVYFGLQSDKFFTDLKELWIVFLPVSLVGLAGVYFLIKRNVKSIIIMIGLGYIIFTSLAINMVYPKIDQLNPVTQALSMLDKERPLAYYQRLNASFPFHHQKMIPNLAGDNQLEAYFKKYPNAYLITRSDYADSISAKGNFREIFRRRELFEPKEVVIFEMK